MKNALLTNVAADWTTLDPQAAIKWATGLPDGPEKESGLVTVAMAWADLDPAAAGEFAQQLSPERIRQEAVVAVMNRWSTQNPEQAAQWLMKCADLQVQQQGMVQLMSFWAAENPQGAERWVETLPSGPSHEVIVQSYVDSVKEWAPDIGAKHAITLADEAVRNQAVENCVKRWLRADPFAAQKWLKETKLPQDVKDRCLLPLDNP
jgi:hypothetical protein